MPQIIWAGQSGCLLPLLIILNLLFGRVFFNSIYLWLGVEAALVFIFIIKIHVFVKKIRQQLWSGGHDWQPDSQTHRPEGQIHKPGRVIDVEGKVIEEKKKLK